MSGHQTAIFATSSIIVDSAEAVRWARRDWELRPNRVSEDALAWALYRNGQVTAALDASTRALSGGDADAHMIFHAATINEAAGHRDVARRLTARLDTMNPRDRDFHAHR